MIGRSIDYIRNIEIFIENTVGSTVNIFSVGSTQVDVVNHSPNIDNSISVIINSVPNIDNFTSVTPNSDT